MTRILTVSAALVALAAGGAWAGHDERDEVSSYDEADMNTYERNKRFEERDQQAGMVEPGEEGEDEIDEDVVTFSREARFQGKGRYADGEEPAQQPGVSGERSQERIEREKTKRRGHVTEKGYQSPGVIDKEEELLEEQAVHESHGESHGHGPGASQHRGQAPGRESGEQAGTDEMTVDSAGGAEAITERSTTTTTRRTTTAKSATAGAQSPKQACESLVQAAKQGDRSALSDLSTTPMQGSWWNDFRNASCETEHVAGRNAVVEANLNTSPKAARTGVTEETRQFFPFVLQDGKWKFDNRTYRSFYRTVS